MKKILVISIIFIIVVVVIAGFWILEGEKNVKHYCDTDSDCVLSGRDPDGFGTCVNKNWNEEWRKNPESKNFVWECLYTGEEKCSCINNKCQRTDSEPGC